jgi:hypothetical protein
MGYTYILLVFSCCKSVLVSEVIHKLAVGEVTVLAMVKICQSFIVLRCINFVLLTS